MNAVLSHALFPLAAAVGLLGIAEHPVFLPGAAEELFLPLPAWELHAEVDPARSIVVVLQKMEAEDSGAQREVNAIHSPMRNIDLAETDSH